MKDGRAQPNTEQKDRCQGLVPLCCSLGGGGGTGLASFPIRAPTKTWLHRPQCPATPAIPVNVHATPLQLGFLSQNTSIPGRNFCKRGRMSPLRRMRTTVCSAEQGGHEKSPPKRKILLPALTPNKARPSSRAEAPLGRDAAPTGLQKSQRARHSALTLPASSHSQGEC